MDTSTDNLRYAMAEQRSFTTSAVIVFFLYFLLWLPGLIFNIVYLREARANQKILGRAPGGMGCLWVLLVFGFLPVVAACTVFGSAFMRGLLGSS
jgi:hypothetical protein